MQNENHLSLTAREIKHFCEILGTINGEYLLYVVFWKLPPKLTQLYNSTKAVEERINIPSMVVNKNYFSDMLPKAMTNLEKINTKF